MNKLKHLTLALFIVTIALAGCKKESQQSQTNNPNTQMSNGITKRILAFRDNLKMKSGGSISIDSATWSLEGLLNLENANNNHQIDGLEFYYDSLVINTSEGSFSINALNDAYEHFTNELDLITQSVNNSYFAFDAVDISVVNTGLKNGEVKLVMGTSGGLQTNTVGNYIAFGSTDYWNWGMDGGKCGAYSGQGGFVDAADKLSYKFNHPLVAREAGFFTDLESHSASGESYPDPNNPGPYCDYKIFFFNAGNTGIWPCLSPEELNYYLSTFPFIVNDNQPEGKTFVNVSVTDVFFPNYTHVYWHEYGLNYGIFHPSGLGS